MIETAEKLEWEPRPILFTADGQPLRRRVGFDTEKKSERKLTTKDDRI